MSKKFLTGLLGGTLFGILFAKKPGKQVRQEIAKASQKEGWKGGVTKLGEELGDLGSEFLETIDTSVPEIKKVSVSAREQMHKGMKKAADTVRDIRNKFDTSSE